MKNYASKKSQKGRLAYRTPDRFIYRKCQQVANVKAKSRKNFSPKNDFKFS